MRSFVSHKPSLTVLHDTVGCYCSRFEILFYDQFYQCFAFDTDAGGELCLPIGSFLFLFIKCFRAFLEAVWAQLNHLKKRFL